MGVAEPIEPVEWRRSKYTTSLVNTIREKLLVAGFHEECGIVPLLTMYSVIARQDEQYFNIRLDRSTLAVIEVVPLSYKQRRDNRVVRVFRGK